VLAATFFARIANNMTSVAMVLFVLQRFQSPELTGVVIFLAIAPGLIVSPVAGALLDRAGRARLMMLDYLMGAGSLGLIVALSWLHRLPVPALLVIVGVSSLTGPLSNAGARSLLPLLVPRTLWDRANALDSMGWTITSIIGPALAGTLVAVMTPEGALLATGLSLVLATLSVAGIHDPERGEASQSLLRDAIDGLTYVVRNPTLRGLALSVSSVNVGSGLVIVAMPVLMLRHLHQGPQAVGLMWAIMGGAATVSGLFAGRIATEGRERVIMTLGCICYGIGSAAMLLPFGPAAVALGMIITGLSNGPYDVAMFSVRQRRTDSAWFGRAFAVSMSLNYSGVPLGSAVAGPIVSASVAMAILLAALCCLGAALITHLTVPARALAPAGVS
jgi:MFS family permease